MNELYTENHKKESAEKQTDDFWFMNLYDNILSVCSTVCFLFFCLKEDHFFFPLRRAGRIDALLLTLSKHQPSLFPPTYWCERLFASQLAERAPKILLQLCCANFRDLTRSSQWLYLDGVVCLKKGTAASLLESDLSVCWHEFVQVVDVNSKKNLKTLMNNM